VQVSFGFQLESLINMQNEINPTEQIRAVPSFSIHQFNERWHRARIQACIQVLESKIESTRDCANESTTISKDELINKSEISKSEVDLLLLCDEGAKPPLLTLVFDNSRKLALSAARYYGVTFEKDEIVQVLRNSNSPCVQGFWRAHNEAFVIERKACGALKRVGSFLCDYWREACDGLVMGLGDEERFVRHASVGHGDENCLDVIFQTYGSQFKWLPIPEFLEKDLQEVVVRMDRLRIKVEFLGYAETKVFYRIENKDDVKMSLCGPGGRYFHDKLKEEVAKFNSKILLQDAAPLAVYGEKA
jgi:hypothetical protein